MKDKDDIAIYILLFGGLAIIAYVWFRFIADGVSWTVALGVLVGGGMVIKAIWLGLTPAAEDAHVADVSNMVDEEFESRNTQSEIEDINPKEVKPTLVTNYKRKSVFALIAGMINLLVAALGIVFYYGNQMDQTQGYILADAVSRGIRAQYLLCGIAAAFLISGYVAPKRGLVLTGAILTSVALFCNLVWFILLVLPVVFAWVGYARMRPTKIEYV